MHAKNCFIMGFVVSALIAIFFFAGVAAGQEEMGNRFTQGQKSAAEPFSVESETGNKNKHVARMTMFQLVMKGGIVGGLIILLSCVALGLVIDYARTIRRAKLAPQEDITAFRELVREHKLEEH